jgi:hypothetical protein
MTDRPAKDFGRRKVAQPVYEEQTSRKRSNQIVLLLMGTMAVGGGAYALMPGETCDPNRPTIEQPGCRQNSSSSSSSGIHGYSGGGSGSSSSSGRSNFASTGSSSSSGYDSSSSSSSHVTHGGFGSFASHFSGGG